MVQSEIADRIEFGLLATIVFLLVPFYAFVRGLQLLAVRSEYSLYEKLLYAPFYTFARIVWRVKVCSHNKLSDLPVRGAILVANHRCSVDPFFVQLAAGRRVHWMVASEYFKHPVFGALLRIFQAIPTTRSGNDNSATKQAVRLASEGRLVGMFPEGRLNRTNHPLISMRPGAILVASRANVPIIPMWIRGAPIGDDVWKPALMPAAVKIYLGSPHDVHQLPVGSNRNEQNQWLRNALLEARPQHEGG